MAALSFAGSGGAQAPAYPTDTITARDGQQIDITFYKHASLAMRAGDKYIYVDPVGSFADYASQPKADLILVTHSHSDHLDTAAIELFNAAQALDFRRPARSSKPVEDMVAAYRKCVPFIGDDEVMYPHIESSVQFLREL